MKAPPDRDARLAEVLRLNLRRRKAQARALGDEAPAASASPVPARSPAWPEQS